MPEVSAIAFLPDFDAPFSRSPSIVVTPALASFPLKTSPIP